MTHGPKVEGATPREDRKLPEEFRTKPRKDVTVRQCYARRMVTDAPRRRFSSLNHVDSALRGKQ